MPIVSHLTGGHTLSEKTWDQLAQERQELTEQLGELEQQLTPLEEVTQANAAVDELRTMLKSTAEGTDGAKSELENYVGKLREVGGEIDKYLGDESVEELVEGVGGGLGEFKDALEAVDEEVARLDQVLDQIQEFMEKADAPADEQLEALADAFEQAVDKLGPLIKRIPGLGTLFEIYALAIKRIAVSVGSIQATQRQLQKAWGQLRPGTTMYLIPRNAHERHQAAIREVELKLKQNQSTMMELAEDLRTQIPDAKPTEIDIAVRAAESRCSDLLPQNNAPELKSLNNAWRSLEDAEEKRNRAADELNRSSALADIDATRLAVVRSAGREGSADMSALRDRAESSARSRDRAQQRLADRETEFDSAMSQFETAKAPWDAIRQAYIDCVKSKIDAFGVHTRQRKGYSESDLRYLRSMYPEYALDEPISLAPTAKPPKEVASLGGRKMLIMGGGGILALAAVGLVFVVFTGGSDDPSNGIEAPASEAQVAVPTVQPQVAVEDSTTTSTTTSPTTTSSTTTSSTTTTLPVATEAIDYVTITGASVLADPSGDVWVELTFAGSWIPGPPALDTAWFMQTIVGITSGGQYNSSAWSLQDGRTRGEGFMEGDVRAAFDGEMWVTPQGRLVVRLPGLSDTGGLSVSDLGPDSEIFLYAQVVPEEGADFERIERTIPMGEVAQSSDNLPYSDWILVTTDFGPITLVIPAGE